MKTAEARKKIISACSTGLKSVPLDVEIDEILESYGKQHAIAFARWNKKYIIPARIAIGLRYKEWINQ